MGSQNPYINRHPHNRPVRTPRRGLTPLGYPCPLSPLRPHTRQCPLPQCPAVAPRPCPRAGSALSTPACSTPACTRSACPWGGAPPGPAHSPHTQRPAPRAGSCPACTRTPALPHAVWTPGSVHCQAGVHPYLTHWTCRIPVRIGSLSALVDRCPAGS